MAGKSQFRLLGQRRFAPFFVTQFLGALNDNVFRNGLLILVTFQGITLAGMNDSQLANVAGALFILPYFLFSATAGQLADKYEKSMLMRRIKLFEIVLMSLASAAFLTGRFELLLGVLFLMGLQSTLFGPAKYGYLPQHLSDSELIGGNALVVAGTYVAIILGLIVGGMSVAVNPESPSLLVSCLLGFALVGYLAARRIPRTPAADPSLAMHWNPWPETRRILGFAREQRSVFLSVLGISWFWFFGSAMTLQVPAYTLDILNGNAAVATALLVTFAIGVGIGALLCERLSRYRIELGLVPLGSIGLTVFAIDLYFAQPVSAASGVGSVSEFLARTGTWRILADFALLGACGGLYSVPLYAMIQQRAAQRHLSRIIAANNIVNSLFMVTASITSLTILGLGFSIPELFLALAALNLLVGLYIYSALPEFLVRCFVWLLTSLVYRLRVSGAKNVPETGAAIVVANHVSYLDPIILAAAIHRPVRFAMGRRIFEIAPLKWFYRQTKAIPFAAAKEDETLVKTAFERIDAELAAGHIVCIFPEGDIIRNGHIQRFWPDIEKILKRRPVTVIPMSLGRLRGRCFSHSAKSEARRWPGRLFARVSVKIGQPVPANDATAVRLEAIVRALRGDER